MKLEFKDKKQAMDIIRGFQNNVRCIYKKQFQPPLLELAKKLIEQVNNGGCDALPKVHDRVKVLRGSYQGCKGKVWGTRFQSGGEKSPFLQVEVKLDTDEADESFSRLVTIYEKMSDLIKI